MNIWVVRDAEPLPTDPGNKRLMRMGMLCETLRQRGHDVTWITSSFDHYGKRHRAAADQVEEIAPNYRIQMLRAPGYASNVSIARIRSNFVFARGLTRFAARQGKRPDVLVTDIPSTEQAAAVVRLGRLWDIPTVLSIRDLWPDFFVDFVPRLLRPGMKLATYRFERQARYAARHATALVGVSQGYLDWGLRKGRRTPGPFDCVIPLGYRPAPPADAPKHEAALLDRHGIDPGKRIVAFVGSWGSTYDLSLVLDTAREFRSRPDVQFVLAGSGEQSERLAMRLASASNVVAPGWLSGDEIGALLRNTDVGLLPYVRNAPQGLPNKIFEYMSYGVFQVSTLAGEAADLLSALNIGISVAPGDPEALQRAIEQALPRAAAPGMRAHIMKAFSADYGAEQVYRRFAELIEKLAQGSGQ